MAGHSHFANIKRHKDKQDAKRAKIFTKLMREVVVAASLGQPDLNFNPRLRAAVTAARREGVPKDRIETAIKKGSGELTGESYDEVSYEGYGPGGVAIIVECLSDNRNRTASEVRSTFTKCGGVLGEKGSVGFMFERVGLIQYKASIANADVMFEAALEAGASNCESGAIHEITCEPDNLAVVRDALQTKFGEASEATLSWKAKDPVPLDNKDKAQAILELIEALEDCDDVQNVYGNFIVPEAVASQL